MAKVLHTRSQRGAESATSSQGSSLIPDEKLVAMYASMVRCRMLQLRAAALFQQGKLDAGLHASQGREACAAAVGLDLEGEDTLSIAPGDWLPAFAKGLPAETIFRALAPRVNGHPASVADEAQKRHILQSQPDQTAMVRERAEALHAAKKHAIVAAFLQPTASPNQWQKLISAAASKKLPILFVEDVAHGRPLVAASTDRRTKTPHALLYGVPVIAVDAADAVALYRVAYEAITRARQGRGATLLECAAVPIIHTIDPATNQPVQAPDPVAIMETYLKRKGIEPEHYNRQVVAEFTRDLDLATRFLTPS